MIDWIVLNFSSIVVLLAVLAAVVLVIRVMVRDKKAGVSSCGGNCSECGCCSSCRKPGAENK